jgi:hypothetical protein
MDLLLKASAAITRILPQCLRALPFPAADRHELWLMDAEAKPFALLAATIQTSIDARSWPEPWAATARGPSFSIAPFSGAGSRITPWPRPSAPCRSVGAPGAANRWKPRQDLLVCTRCGRQGLGNGIAKIINPALLESIRAEARMRQSRIA